MGTTAAIAKTPAQSRLVYLDNLRVLLISIIVLLHLAITYGAPGGWYVHEVSTESLGLGEMLAFVMYNATVQAFALGFFFLISGYFTAASLERKGTRKFLTDRLIRLGIPIALYMTVVNPGMHYFLYSRDMPFGSFLAYHFTHAFSTGPMWFVATLLIFSLIYIVWRAVRGSADDSSETATASLPRNSLFFVLAVITGLIAFAIRFIWRVGWSMPILNFQLSYFTEYIMTFFLGTAAWRIKWFEQVTEYRAGVWLGYTAFIVLTLPVMFILGGQNGADVFNGGMSWQAFSYAMWEPFVCLGAVIGLSSLFAARLNGRGGWFGTLPPNAYAVYFIHPVVLITLTSAFIGLALPPLVKFAVMTPVVLVSCFAVAGLLRAIPGVKRVL